MSDDSFIREVNEELRHEQMKQAWSRYGKWIIAAALTIIVGVGGWRLYGYYTETQAAKSGDAFEKAIDLSREGKKADAIKLLEKLAQDGYGQYPALAQMRIAAERAATGDTKKAIEEFNRIAADKSFDKILRDIATIRAGTLMVDNDTLEAVKTRLEPYAAAGKPFRASAREAIALAAWKAKDYPLALKLFNEIVADNASPEGMTTRAKIMLDLIASLGISVEPEAAADKGKPDSAKPKAN